MAISNARLSYSDCYEYFDAALADAVGVRIKLEDPSQANFLRMRLHQARKIDRNDNKKTFETDDPMYGKSVYDQLIVQLRVEDDITVIYIRKIESTRLEVESLSEPAPEVIQEPVKRRI